MVEERRVEEEKLEKRVNIRKLILEDSDCILHVGDNVEISCSHPSKISRSVGYYNPQKSNEEILFLSFYWNGESLSDEGTPVPYEHIRLIRVLPKESRVYKFDDKGDLVAPFGTSDYYARKHGIE